MGAFPVFDPLAYLLHCYVRSHSSQEKPMSVLIEPAELQVAMACEPMVVIDTRDPGVYAKGHLPGAVNLREIFTYLATSDPDGLESLKEKFVEAFGAAGLSGKETAVLYEDAMNTGFGQSCRGYFILSYLGYPNVKVLHGGYQAWLAAGLPTSTEAVTPAPATFPTHAAVDVMVDRDAMLAAVKSGSATLLGVRDVDEWIGASSLPYGPDFCPRKGRIPNARWIEWYRLMKPGADGPVFKSKDEVFAGGHALTGLAPAHSSLLAMAAIGWTMSQLFAYLYFVLFASLERAVAASDTPAAAQAMTRIRPVMATNPALGQVDSARCTRSWADALN